MGSSSGIGTAPVGFSRWPGSEDSEPLVDDPVRHFHIVASSPTHYLFSNQP